MLIKIMIHDYAHFYDFLLLFFSLYFFFIIFILFRICLERHREYSCLIYQCKYNIIFSRIQTFDFWKSKKMIFVKKIAFWPTKKWFLSKNRLLTNKKNDFCQKNRLLTEILIFVKKSTFDQHFDFCQKIDFWPIFWFLSKNRLLTKLLIFVKNFIFVKK